MATTLSLWVSLCVVFLAGTAQANILDFDCESDHLGPILDRLEEAERGDRHSYPVEIHVPSHSYTPSQEIQVTFTIKGEVEIRSFASQMRLANSRSIRGTWLVEESHELARTHGCLNEADTLMNLGSDMLSVFTATWVAPHHRSQLGDEEVELLFSVMTPDGKYWTSEEPILLQEAQQDVHQDAREFEEPAVNHDLDEDEAPNTEGEEEDTGPVENPNEPEMNAEREREEADERDRAGEEMDRREEENADHGLTMEIDMIKLRQEKLANEIADEDRASEGDWSRVQEEERRAREEAAQREMYEYERTKAEEEDARRARMRAEIRDKEQYEAEQARLSTKKPSTERPTRTPPKATTPKDDSNDLEKDPNEIDIDGADNVDGDKTKDSGSAILTATLVTLFISFLACVL